MFLFCAFFFLVCFMANDVAVSRQRWPFQAASKSPIGHQRVNPMAIAGHGQKKSVAGSYRSPSCRKIDVLQLTGFCERCVAFTYLPCRALVSCVSTRLSTTRH